MNSKSYDKAELEYLKAKHKWRESKDHYEFIKAKRRIMTKSEMVANGEKPTLHDLEDRLLLEQNNLETELGQAYIYMTKTQAEKEVKHQTMKSEERKYWTNKDLITGGE